MLISTGLFALQAISDFLSAVFLLRFYLFLIRVNLGSIAPELSRFVFVLTDWAVLKLRRVVSPVRQFDIASLTPVLFIQLLFLVIKSWALTGQLLPADVFRELILNTSVLVVNGFLGVIFLLVIISWIQAHSNFHHLLNKLSEPILNPLRRLIPQVGGLDLSPLVALLILQIILRLLPSIIY